MTLATQHSASRGFLCYDAVQCCQYTDVSEVHAASISTLRASASNITDVRALKRTFVGLEVCDTEKLCFVSSVRVPTGTPCQFYVPRCDYSKLLHENRGN